MKPEWWNAAEKKADEAVENFTDKLKHKLDNEKPGTIIRRKNPFLFRVRFVDNVHEYAEMMLDAYLSSSEETMFGNVLEEIAIAICSQAKGGRKSGISNIDLEYDEGNTRTIIQIKSGTNWGNSSQHRALRQTFINATKVLRQGGTKLSVRCVEGCCYGKSETKEVGTHQRIVGRHFWKDISGWDGTTESVMQLLGRHASNGLYEIRAKARERMLLFMRDSGVIGRDNYIPDSGIIDEGGYVLKDSDAVEENDYVRWDKLLELVMR